MHYWSVWHEAKDFSAYRDVNPRFASEFGFQSFTSMNVIETFSKPEDRNPSPPVMESHERNAGGNARIVETMTRYFRFPSNFEQMVFLSQVQQGLAIKTAIEYWRSTKPRCLGTLYWQVNDTYPVASWASLDYGGRWTLLHYMAKRFFLPVSVVAVPENEKGEIWLKAVNDTAAKADITLEVRAVDVAGGDRVLHSGKASTSPDRAMVAARIPLGKLGENEFLFFSWRDTDGNLLGENHFMPRAYKAYDLPQARVKAKWSGGDKAPVLTLSTDKPALFATASVDVPGYVSDNAVTLLPGRETRLRVTPRHGARVTQKAAGREPHDPPLAAGDLLRLDAGQRRAIGAALGRAA